MTMHSYTDEQVLARIVHGCSITTGDMLESLLADRQRLQAEVDGLREFIERWTADGHLQTFEDRQRFRKEARATPNETKEAKS